MVQKVFVRVGELSSCPIRDGNLEDAILHTQKHALAMVGETPGGTLIYISNGTVETSIGPKADYNEIKIAISALRAHQP